MTAARPCRQSWMRSGRASLTSPVRRSCVRCRDSCRHCTADINDEAGRLQYLQTQGVCPTCLRRIDGGSFPEIQAAFARRLQKIQTDGVALRQQRQALAMQESQARLDFNALKSSEITRLEQELASAQADNAAQQRELIKAKIKELSARRALGRPDR